MADFLKNNEKEEYCLMGYRLKNTLTENGSVKRGVCQSKDNYLTAIIESTIEKKEDKLIATPLSGEEPFEVSPDRLVSLNMFGFTKEIFPYLEEKITEFLTDPNTNLEKDEILVPCVVEDSLKEGKSKVRVIETSSTWYGVTYREDKEYVMKGIKSLIDENVYPNNLW